MNPNQDLINEAEEFVKYGSDLNPVEADRLISELCDALATPFSDREELTDEQVLAALNASIQEERRQMGMRPLPKSDVSRELSDWGKQTIARMRAALTAAALAAPVAVDEAKLAQAKYAVDSIHQIHGATCLCGFSSARSRSRTEHITEALARRLGGGER